MIYGNRLPRGSQVKKKRLGTTVLIESAHITGRIKE
jgi:hypothetical protein